MKSPAKKKHKNAKDTALNRLKSTLITVWEFKQEGNKTSGLISTGNVYVGDSDFSYSVYACKWPQKLRWVLTLRFKINVSK